MGVAHSSCYELLYELTFVDKRYLCTIILADTIGGSTAFTITGYCCIRGEIGTEGVQPLITIWISTSWIEYTIHLPVDLLLSCGADEASQNSMICTVNYHLPW